MIRDKFPDPKMAFLVMDESGDGSLSRKEFARGLRVIGIELKAHELANLIELLDDDGGGEIDAEEFIAFVNGTD
jgi:Ca2+-binding EF-hand superfamily protein